MPRSSVLATLMALALVTKIGAQTPPLATYPAGTYRDPASAMLLSAAFLVVPTVAGIAMVSGEEGSSAGGWLIIGGLTLGPAIGYFSTGRVGRGLTGAGIRTGVLFATGLLALSSSETSSGESIALGGITLSALLAVYDVATVRRKRPVDRIAQRVRLYPTYVAATKSPGLGVNVSF